MSNPAFRDLRLAELESSLQLLETFGAKSGDLLEIGAGTGWQAKALSKEGYHVEAIDLPAESGISGHARAREWPITDYDGVHIPFGDATFDIIYSSNVLEHVTELDGLMRDMKRVLRKDGIALHLLPNPQWRVLSLIAYYPAQAVDFLRWLRKDKPNSLAAGSGTASRSQSIARKAFGRLIPHAHGAVGTALGELSRFSKGSWDRYFQHMGWDVLYYGNNGLAASGEYLLGSALSIQSRRMVGRLIGGIAHVYVVRPKAKS
jgi:SAM-dependent methyltransferase